MILWTLCILLINLGPKIGSTIKLTKEIPVHIFDASNFGDDLVVVEVDQELVNGIVLCLK